MRLLLWLTLLLAAPPLAAQQPRWVASWGTSPMALDANQQLPAEALGGATLRQVVRLSAGGEQLRVRVSNAFGSQPLNLRGVNLALAAKLGTAAIVAGSDRPLTFSGKRAVFVPAGGEMLSDPVALAAPALAHVAISLRFAEAPPIQTGHPGSRATSFLLAGDHLADADLPGALRKTGWWQISGIDVVGPVARSAIVALGDSITDGHGVPDDTDGRWPDRLAERLQADPAMRHLSVINQGIGGNRILRDGAGPNALARFDRDVLGQAGVSHFILLEGVNDIGSATREAPATPAAHKAEVDRILGVYAQLVARARQRGIKAIGGTILPFGGSGYAKSDPANEADRLAINAWIRTPGNFDAVIDFDAATRDPKRPDYIRADYDGDRLHPSVAGYRAMGDAVDLKLFDDRPMIALTFDDLPLHKPLPKGTTPQQVTDDILTALKGASVAEAYGFVNAKAATRDPALAKVLKSWRAAGYPLGNHGWSHQNLDTVGAKTFITEIKRNEPTLRKLMAGRDWRWFRYPFLVEGSDLAVRAAVRKHLASSGYRIAPVSMSFPDWDWNGAYARCSAQNDQAEIARMETGFLAAARNTAAGSRAAARSRFGRDIPYVLLLHVGAFDARMLPRLLAQYRSDGFRFGSLAEAVGDPVYATDARPALPPRPLEPAGMLPTVGRPDYGTMLAKLCPSPA